MFDHLASQPGPSADGFPKNVVVLAAETEVPRSEIKSRGCPLEIESWLGHLGQATAQSSKHVGFDFGNKGGRQQERNAAGCRVYFTAG